MLTGSEGFAGHCDDMAFVQEAGGEFGGGADALFAKVSRDVGIHIKRALGPGASHAGDFGELGQHVVAQADEFSAEFSDAVLRTGQGGDGSLLDDAGGIGGLLGLELAEICDDGLGSHGVTSPPTGHGIGLGERAEDDHVLFGPCEGAGGDRLARVVEVDVALIDEQVDSAFMGEMDDALEVFGGDIGTSRIGRRIKDDGLGARGDGLLNGFGSHAEIFCFAGLEKNDLAAGILNDVFEADPVRDGKDDFVAVIDEDLHSIEEGVLFAGGEDGFVDGVIGAEVAGVAVDNGLANVGNSGNHGVAGEVSLDGDNGGVLDMARRGEMGFARTEIDEVDALSAKLGGFGGNGHGGGNFNASDAVCKDFGGSGNSHDVILADFGRWGNPRFSETTGAGRRFGWPPADFGTGRLVDRLACGKIGVSLDLRGERRDSAFSIIMYWR